MSEHESFSERVKRVIEAHGGRVEIDIIPGIVVQPKELRDESKHDRFFADVFEPVNLFFNGEKVGISTQYNHALTLTQAHEYVKYLHLAIAIVEEIVATCPGGVHTE